MLVNENKIHTRNNDVTNEEIHYFRDKIKRLQFTIIRKGYISITHKMILTMVDGKVCNAATQTVSTMRCSKKKNNSFKRRSLESANLEFGHFILHARIRLSETLLHLPYKNTSSTQITGRSDHKLRRPSSNNENT